MAYIGPYPVPDGTPGSTPGAPVDTPRAPLDPVNGALFMGLQPPLTVGVDPKSGVSTMVTDANGKTVVGRQAEQIWASWQTEKVRRTDTAQRAATVPGSSVAPADLKQALDQYRGAIDKANTQYGSVLDYRPTPTAQGTQTPVQAGAVSLDPTRADQTRGQQQGNLADLQRAAQGQGPAADLARARLAQALRRSGAQAAGIALGATGAARKGALRTSMLAASEGALNAGEQVAAIEAQDRQQAQAQLTGALQGVRGQDLTQAGQLADVDAQNANRDLTAATTRNDQALRAQGQDEDQRVANERLKLDASKAATDAAQGLLTENARQEQIAFARQQLQQAKDQADRQFWGNIITSLLSGATAVGAAAVGKPTTSDERAKENISPVKQGDLNALAKAVRGSLATWNYKRAEDGPAGERAGPMAQDLEKTRLGKTVVSEREDGTKQVDYGQLATLLAAATVKARKREAVS